jgi:hypothetical protein
MWCDVYSGPSLALKVLTSDTHRTETGVVRDHFLPPAWD